MNGRLFRLADGRYLERMTPTVFILRDQHGKEVDRLIVEAVQLSTEPEKPCQTNTPSSPLAD